MTTENNNAFERMQAIPDYAQAEPDVREKLDGIIAATDMYDPDSLHGFGDIACARRDQVAEQILEAQEGGLFHFMQNPLEEAAGFMERFNLPQIQEKMTRMAERGAGVVGRNKGMVALTALAGVLTGGLGLAVGAGTIAAKEGVNNGTNRLSAFARKQLSQRFNVETETPAQLEEQLREGIANFKPMVRKLQEAQASIPELREKIKALGQANLEALYGLALYIGAGREILERIESEVALQETKGAFDVADTLTESHRVLSGKLLILGNAHNSCLIDVSIMKNLLAAVNDNGEALQSILTHEVQQLRSSMGATAVTVDSMRLTRVVTEYRARAQQTVEGAITGAARAQQLAAANKAGSPEQMERMLKNLEQIRAVIDSSLRRNPQIARDQARLALAVDKAAQDLVQAQVRQSQEIASQSQKALPSPQGAPRLAIGSN
jgi:hypothetical protein